MDSTECIINPDNPIIIPCDDKHDLIHQFTGQCWQDAAVTRTERPKLSSA